MELRAGLPQLASMSENVRPHFSLPLQPAIDGSTNLMKPLTRRIVTLLCLFHFALCLGGTGWAEGTIRVFDQREFVAATAYVDVLEALQGEEPTRALFASQGVQLSSFVPRDAAGSEAKKDADQGLRATIDIGGNSAEFGCLQYVMTVNAADEATSIDVLLVRPSGMLRGQRDQFHITPLGDSHSSIRIAHTLDVLLMQRRHWIVNNAILKITCREANSQVRELTRNMTCSVASLATSSSSVTPDATEPSAAGAESEAIDEDAQEGPERTEEPESKGVETTADAKADPKKLSLKVVVSGADGNGGEMRIALFNSKEQYTAFDARKEEAKQGEAFRKEAVKIGDGNLVTYSLEDIPPGTYAIAAFHDKDGNRKLNSSFLGLPSEPYGFTRDARGSLGLPPYEQAMIEFSEKNSVFKFKVK